MGPFKCPDCGVWWAGVEHRCAIVMPGGIMPPGTVPDPGDWVVRPYVSPDTGIGTTTAAPWCWICHGWHVPGMGTCTRTYST